jgi:hypothetical protein
MGRSDRSDAADRSIDRRALIRRAAATGALVWTAPVVIDSLASPAAAATGFTPPCGCSFLVFNSNCAINGNQTPCNSIPPGCVPTAGLDACFQQSCPADGSITVTSTCGPNCEISNATAKDGDDCVQGTITNTNGVDTVTWPPPLHGNYAQITVFLNCVCP